MHICFRVLRMRILSFIAPRLLSLLHMSARTFSESASVTNHPKTLQIGLTGSIGMGKSTITKQFRQLGFPVFDADDAVHELYSERGEAVPLIQSLVPEAIVNNAVCRKTLSEHVLRNNQLLKQLEGIVHPLVKNKRERFYQTACEQQQLFVVYDIPLLLENLSNHQVDYVVVASASAETQQQRVLSRPGMTLDKFRSIVGKQMPDAEKRARADFIVNTDYPDFSSARAQVAKLLEQILEKHPEHWNRYKNRRRSDEHPVVNNKEVFALSDYVDLVVFDLDDTLVPTEPALRAAQQAFLAFVSEKAPKTHVDLQQGKIGPVMKALAAEFPLLKHDLTEIRKQALMKLLRSNDEYDDDLVEQSIQLFIKNRNLVDPYLYADTLPCLEWLRSQGVRVAVVTNGTANLTQSPVLNAYLDLSLCAGDTGAMKPSPVPFLAVLQRLGVCASRTVFVGDSYENDVVGSKRCGMHSVFLVRDSTTEGSTGSPPTTTPPLSAAAAVDKDNAQVMDLSSPQPVSSYAYRPEPVHTADRDLADITVTSLYPHQLSDKLKEYFMRN